METNDKQLGDLCGNCLNIQLTDPSKVGNLIQTRCCIFEEKKIMKRVERLKLEIEGYFEAILEA